MLSEGIRVPERISAIPSEFLLKRKRGNVCRTGGSEVYRVYAGSGLRAARKSAGKDLRLVLNRQCVGEEIRGRDSHFTGHFGGGDLQPARGPYLGVGGDKFMSDLERRQFPVSDEMILSASPSHQPWTCLSPLPTVKSFPTTCGPAICG